MSKLLDQVVAGKKAYQVFTIHHGIEQIAVKIPIKEARAFETAFQQALSSGTTSKDGLLSIVKQHSGKLDRKGQ